MNDLIRKIAMLGTGIFALAWAYVVILKHIQHGRVVSVAGFLVMLFIVFQFVPHFSIDYEEECIFT